MVGRIMVAVGGIAQVPGEMAGAIMAVAVGATAVVELGGATAVVQLGGAIAVVELVGPTAVVELVGAIAVVVAEGDGSIADVKEPTAIEFFSLSDKNFVSKPK